MRVFVGQPEHPDAAADAAGLKGQIVEPDIGDGDLALDQRRVDPQRAAARFGEPGVKAAKPAGRQCFPAQRRGTGLAKLLVEVP